jgi:hypothetical protein
MIRTGAVAEIPLRSCRRRRQRRAGRAHTWTGKSHIIASTVLRRRGQSMAGTAHHSGNIKAAPAPRQALGQLLVALRGIPAHVGQNRSCHGYGSARESQPRLRGRLSYPYSFHHATQKRGGISVTDPVLIMKYLCLGMPSMPNKGRHAYSARYEPKLNSTEP